MEIEPTSLAPSENEISFRIDNLQRKIQQSGFDFYICHDPANIFYLTNFANFVHERPFIFIVPCRGRATFIMPRLEMSHVKIRSVGDFEIADYREFPAPHGEGWADQLRDILGNSGKVGLEPMCPLAVSNEIQNEVRVEPIVEELREIKSDYEISRIAYTCDLLSEGHQLLLELASPGQLPIVLHKEVSSRLYQKMLMDNMRCNVLNSKFNVATQPSVLSSDPHDFTEIYSPLVDGGPHVTIVQGLANGYGAELERTFFIGSAPEQTRKPFDDMIAARALAYEQLKPGVTMSEIDRQVNGYLVSRGYGDNLLHRTGHSFGVTDHEGPFLAEGWDEEIKENMIFSIEPGIYIPDVGGFRFSDTVLVTKNGYKKLTRAPECLSALTIDLKPETVTV